MNWVGGARSRVKQSQERKIQKEFFARQKLAKKVNIHKRLSPKGHRKPISLDLLSLQTVNQTHQRENGIRKQPVKVVLGDRSNLLPRRQEDLELPMSPIRNPSSLAFLDSKTEMDTHSRHVPHQLHKPLESHDKRHQATGFKLNNRIRPSNDVEYSNIILPPHTSRDVSQLSESLISFHNSPEQLSSTKHQKRIKEPAPRGSHDQCLPGKMPKKDILAFQRAEKEKYMASKPLAKRLHQTMTNGAKTSEIKCVSNVTIDDESPTVRASKSAAANVVNTFETKTITLSASKNDPSDGEKKMLVGYYNRQSLHDTTDHTTPCKKTKTSSFEEMVKNYERPITSKKSVADGKHDAWWKFIHGKSSLADDMCKVPDVSVVPPVTEKKEILFFKQKLPKTLPTASMKRPPTVLQELFCMDEDLNNSDLFQTQDFTFENALTVDFEEPLKQYQCHTEEIANENTFRNYHSMMPTEEVQTSNQQDHKEQLPEGVSLSTSTGTISVGVQCDNIKSLHGVETQTEWYPLVKHSSTQSDVAEMVDSAVQATTNNCSVMTQTIDDMCPNDHPSINYADKLAEAQNIIVWQSLMIKILEVDVNCKN